MIRILAVVALVTFFMRPAPELPAMQARRSGEFLGFALGEERRYVLGPTEALNANESARWSIRLASVSGDPPVGTFWLTHERNDPELNRDLSRVPMGKSPLSLRWWKDLRPEYRDAVYVRMTGRVRLNHRGFPLDITFTGVQRFANRAHELSLRYTLDDETYIKEVTSNGREWSFRIPVGADIRLETDPLAGLYAWFPTDMRCLGRGSVMQYVADLSATTAPCEKPVLLFANPGLLDVALAAHGRSGDELVRLWFLTPTGPLTNGPGARAGFSVGALARDESQYYRQEALEYIGRSSIDVGDLHLSVFERALGSMRRAIYIDSEGRVVRVDLGSHPISSRPRWIRLLSDSEQ